MKIHSQIRRALLFFTVSAICISMANPMRQATGAELLGYYEFEGDYEDSSGNGNTAEPIDDPEITDGGFRGQGVEFMPGGGGGGAKVDIPIDGHPFENPVITWGAWANSNTDSSFDGFMSIDNGGWDRGIFLNRNNDTWGIASGAGPDEPGPPVTVGEWQYVVGTFNFDDDRITLYVGDADPTNPTTESLERFDAAQTAAEPTIEIGRYDNQDFDGFVDDAFVFDDELDIHQVNAIRNLRLSSVDFSPIEAEQLFALFDAGSGTADIGGATWSHTTGLDATNPGQVFETNGIAVVLADDGRGLTADSGEIQPRLQAGDADMDLDFDTLDLVKVQIAAKYLTEQAATWGEGDWNGSPGGSPGNPPAGDGIFDPLDIISALNGNTYLTGPYAAIKEGGVVGDGQTTLVYDPGSGELSVDPPAGIELTSINITSSGGLFTGDKPAALDGAFDNFAADNIFKATFGGSFGSISFGSVLPAGLDSSALASDLSAVGSRAGGGDLGDVDLVVIPEPTTSVMLTMLFALSLFAHRRKR